MVNGGSDCGAVFKSSMDATVVTNVHEAGGREKPDTKLQQVEVKLCASAPL